VLALDGHKECGAAATDWDGDGDLDLVAPEGQGVRLLRNDGSLRDWSDETGSLAPDLLGVGVSRGLLAADLTHDGWPDLVRVSAEQAELWVHRGPSLGWTRELTFSSADSFEGSALLDVDSDGWLDVLVTDGIAANWVLFNPADGSAGFEAVDQGPLGMRPSQLDSDFATTADWDTDGDPDVVIRGEGWGTDAFRRFAGGWDPWNDLHVDGQSTEKGGVALCDVRGAGQLDLLWTSPVEPAFRHYVWEDEWDSVGPEELGVTGATSVACGDMDNDGIVDVLLSDDDNDELFFGPALEHLPLEDDERPTIALTLADFDGDGDLDLYQINDEAESSLFENDLASEPALRISPRVEVQSCPGPVILREAIGAQGQLSTPEGEPLGSLQEISGGFGRGQTSAPQWLFGGVASPDLVLRLRFAGLPAVEVQLAGAPSELVVTTLDPDGDGLRDESLTEDADGDNFVDAFDGDADGDGYSDREESALPALCEPPADFDGDGTPDHLDPDSDDDGIPDARDPGRIDLDADGDGLLDADEVAQSTDPGQADTDGGGRSDGQEVYVDETDPLDPTDDVLDSDRDGLSDEEELALGTDPHDPDSDGDGAFDSVDGAPLDAGGAGTLVPDPPYGCGCAGAPGPVRAPALIALGLTLGLTSLGRRPRARRPAG
jgi:hypothetical protein